MRRKMTMLMTHLLMGTVLLADCARESEIAKLQENPVPAIGQNAEDMVGLTTTGGLRVLFVGNSITLHGPRPQIGWTNNWGMAATAPEKDYVHVLAGLIRTKYPDASFGLVQVAAKIERSLDNVDLKPFKWVRDWRPDVITLFYGANCDRQYDGRGYDGRFTRATEQMLDYVDPEHKAKVFHAEGFYIRPAIDWEKRLMAGRRGDVHVPMDDLRRRKDTHGRYNHPSDLGMRLIAERFWKYIEPELSGADRVLPGDRDVRAFGAKGDGVTKDTEAIQRAIDACSAAGGGRVVLTPGTYLTGALRMKGGVELHLQRRARLLASPDLADFPDWTDVRHVTTSALPRGRNACVLFADEAHDIAITGPGVIDGNGTHHVVPQPPDHKGWPFRRRLPPEKTLPRVVFFTGCTNVTVKGVTLVNPPAGWSYWIHDCDRVVFRDCRVETDVRYPNNDGIHINCSRDVEISNCDLTTGDDAIIVRANSRSLAENKACERVTVSNCVLRSWASGVRLGWTNDGLIRDCRFSNLTMRDTSVGVAYVLPDVHGTDFGREATTLENILFENVEMNGTCGRPILVKFAPAEKGTMVGSISNVVFRRVTSRGLEKPLLLGGQGVSLDGMTFEDCRFDVVDEKELPDPHRHGAAAWDREKNRKK